MSASNGLEYAHMRESVKTPSYLSLAEAQASGRLDDFVSQEERREVGPAATVDLDAALSRLIKSEKSEDRTLRSASSDGSSGTKTR